MNLNYSTLLLGTDIPFTSAQLVIHQPRLKEIGFLGDKDFFSGVFMLDFSKSSFNLQGKEQLEDKTDFELFMMLFNEKNEQLRQTQVCAQLVLLLLFPQYTLKVTKQCLLLIKEQEIHRIDKTNYDDFREIIQEIFCLDQLRGDGKGKEYNPKGVLAKQIADKIKKGRQKLASLKGESEGGDFSIVGRYISILTVGLQKDINVFQEYTIFQLFDQYKRYIMKYEADIYLKAQLAGAKDMKEPDNWMGDIYRPQQSNQDIKDKTARSTKKGTITW